MARTLIRLAAGTSWLLTAHVAVNARLLRTPPDVVGEPAERVSVLLPVRDEAERIAPCLRALLAALPADAELLVLDDSSADGTGVIARALLSVDSRARVLTGAPLPEGWLGKPHACRQLAAAADPRSTLLLFVDADVIVAPDAVRATVALLRDHGLDLVSPYPLQLADGLLPRIIQPLLQWSWLAFLPLRAAEGSARPALSAANGQLLAVDRATYDRAGGHVAVRSDVLDDIGLLRAMKAVGGVGGVADGTGLAECRMYSDGAALREGYAKSLMRAFGGPAGAFGVAGLMTGLYVAPLAGLLVRGYRVLALSSYAAGVMGRGIAARRTGGRSWPDPLAHPASVAAFAGLVVDAWRRRGTVAWKGRRVA